MMKPSRKENKPSSIESVILGIFVLTIIYFINIIATVTVEKAINYTKEFDENGKLKQLVKESLKDGKLSFIERIKIYNEVDNQIDISKEKLSSGSIVGIM